MRLNDSAMDTKAYIPMPPHSRCNINGKYYEIISHRTIKKDLAIALLDKKEFENGVDRDLLKRHGIEDTSSWWYNSVDDLVMIKGKSGRYYIKKIRTVSDKDLSFAYQIACANYMVISQYVADAKRKL